MFSWLFYLLFRLLTKDGCQKDGGHASGLRFPIEVTPGIVGGWPRNEKGIDLPLIDELSREIYGTSLERAKGFSRVFFGM
jgi:hypothetical protein